MNAVKGIATVWLIKIKPEKKITFTEGKMSYLSDALHKLNTFLTLGSEFKWLFTKCLNWTALTVTATVLFDVSTDGRVEKHIHSVQAYVRNKPRREKKAPLCDWMLHKKDFSFSASWLSWAILF